MLKIGKLFLTFGIALTAVGAFAQKIERPEWSVNDRWEYRSTQRNSGNTVSEYAHHIEKIEDGKILIRRSTKNAEGVFVPGGLVVYDQDMNYIGDTRVSNTPSTQTLQWPLEIGKKYPAEFKWDNKTNGRTGTNEYKAEVVGEETITVPAGTFKALKIVFKGYWNARGSENFSGRASQTVWYASETKRWVKFENQDRNSQGTLNNDNVAELLKYTPGK